MLAADLLSAWIKKVRQYGNEFLKKEAFIDHPWVFIDEESQQQTYIFKADGRLIMSLAGAVKMGRWELLHAAKSLLIDRGTDHLLLQQSFADNAVMALQMDGKPDSNFILVNRNLVPDLDVVTYLKRLFYQRNNVRPLALKDGRVLERYARDGYTPEMVTEDGNPIASEELITSNGNVLIIENSRIVKSLKPTAYVTRQGEITVLVEYGLIEKAGDRVFLNGGVAPDGKYKIGFMQALIVKNGTVQKVAHF